MFRVPLRFLSSLFLFFNIISTLQDQNQVVVFSSSYLLQTPSSHWWVSHQSNNQSNVSERKQWEPFTLLHFTAAPLLQWSTQLSAPTPPLWSTLLFSQWWLTHTECFFFFFLPDFSFLFQMLKHVHHREERVGSASPGCPRMVGSESTDVSAECTLKDVNYSPLLCRFLLFNLTISLSLSHQIVSG